MTSDQARHLIKTDGDFIYSKRFNYSLRELKRRHPEECPDRIIAAVLMITEDDVKELYERVVAKLQRLMLTP